jgi:YesN/AraC family two-component response regulator
MVCLRCKMVVQSELRKLGIHYAKVELGEVTIFGNMNEVQQDHFGKALLKHGLELMDDKKAVLIEKIKITIVEMIHYSEEPLTIKFSTYLSEKVHHDYGYLSNLFSQVEGITLEKYLISHRIERVKELLVYHGLTLTQVANQMNYCSVAHLSAQFKKITGLTPSHFKELTEIRSKM